MTDYTLHSQWIHADTHKYYVAKEELKAAIITKGAASAHQIQVTGIPVRSAFYEELTDLDDVLPGFQLSKELILIAAGAYGVVYSHPILMYLYMDSSKKFINL